MAKLTIFLDIDGVLNVWGPNSQKGRIELSIHPWAHFNATPLTEFASFIQTISAQLDDQVEVVICSTWRNIFKYEEMLVAGEEATDFGHVTSKIPKDRWRTGISKHAFRGDDVSNYCTDHNITTFICIDDDSDYYNWQNLIQTKGSVGFSKDTREAILRNLDKLMEPITVRPHKFKIDRSGRDPD